jgi:hypothetical protein
MVISFNRKQGMKNFAIKLIGLPLCMFIFAGSCVLTMLN